MNINTPNSRMMMAPPMAQVVHTMLAQVLLVPPKPERELARAERERGERRNGMAVPRAMAKVAATPAQNSPCVPRKREQDRDRGMA
jgi:hypothetical protein